MWDSQDLPIYARPHSFEIGLKCLRPLSWWYIAMIHNRSFLQLFLPFSVAEHVVPIQNRLRMTVSQRSKHDIGSLVEVRMSGNLEGGPVELFLSNGLHGSKSVAEVDPMAIATITNKNAHYNLVKVPEPVEEPGENGFVNLRVELVFGSHRINRIISERHSVLYEADFRWENRNGLLTVMTKLTSLCYYPQSMLGGTPD